MGGGTLGSHDDGMMFGSQESRSGHLAKNFKPTGGILRSSHPKPWVFLVYIGDEILPQLYRYNIYIYIHIYIYISGDYDLRL